MCPGPRGEPGADGPVLSRGGQGPAGPPGTSGFLGFPGKLQRQQLNQNQKSVAEVMFGNNTQTLDKSLGTGLTLPYRPAF